eukprot:SAG22_NODE_4156_length_1365_cov_2.436019_1_plen_80_part_10
MAASVRGNHYLIQELGAVEPLVLVVLVVSPTTGISWLSYASATCIDIDKTRGNHMMSPEFIWFHPGAVSVPTYGSNEKMM